MTIVEASYKGNIGIMELAKFHASATPEKKARFTQLMQQRAKATKEKEQQITAQIWDLVQSVTGIKLHQMESIKMKTFKELSESTHDEHISNALASKDINATVKDGKVVVYDKANHKPAERLVKRLGYTHKVELQKEEIELDEEIKPGDRIHLGLVQKGGAGYRGTVHKIEGDKVIVKGDDTGGKGNYGTRLFRGVLKNATKINESEQIDELSKKTLGSYLEKSFTDAADRARKRGGDVASDPSHFSKPEYKKQIDTHAKRHVGHLRAIRKIAKEETELSELSKATLGAYINKAHSKGQDSSLIYHTADSGSKREAKHFRKTANRAAGIQKAVARLTQESLGLAEKKEVAVLKPRNQHLNRVLTAKSNAAGAHRDKKKEFKHGEGKYKKNYD